MIRVLRAAVLVATVAVSSVVVAVPALAADPSITLHVSTPRQVDHQLTLSGDVANPPTAPATVTATRTAPGSSTPIDLMPAMTDDNGHYVINDTPVLRGTTTYTVTVQGSTATTQQTVFVRGLPTSLGMTRSARTVR